MRCRLMPLGRDKLASHVGSGIYTQANSGGGSAAACRERALHESTRRSMASQAAHRGSLFAGARIVSHHGTFQGIPEARGDAVLAGPVVVEIFVKARSRLPKPEIPPPYLEG